MADRMIMIVEDNQDTLELLCAQLDSPEYRVLTAADGQEAVLTVGAQAPDLVIMDIMMPKLDGLETSRYFKLKFRERFVPVLVPPGRSQPRARFEAVLEASSSASGDTTGASWACMAVMAWARASWLF